LNRHGCASGADHETEEAPRLRGRREQRGCRADVRTHDVRVLETECVGHADDEVAHRPRRHQRISPLRTPEPWQIDRDQVSLLGQARPHCFVREDALGPRTEQQRIRIALIAFGEPNRYPIDCPK
jgi:hypothetical protein